MKRSLLMFAAAASFLVPAATPMVVLAQDRPEARDDSPRRGDRRGQAQRERGDMAVSPRQRQEAPRTERRAETRAQNQPGARADGRSEQPRRQRPASDAQQSQQRPDWNRPDAQRPGRAERQDRSERPSRRDQSRPDQSRPDRANRPDQNRPDWNRPDRSGPDRQDRRDWNRPGRPDAQRPNRPDRPNQWNRDRDRDYREFRNRWNRDQWRRDWDRRHRNDWWRNDSRFRGWSGVRLGFYFAPGYGYYSVPQTYWNRQWYVGQYLPDIFWRYQVNDWRTYGLGYPPPGTRWVYVDNSIYLIDEYDGYIIEVIRDAWRW